MKSGRQTQPDEANMQLSFDRQSSFQGSNVLSPLGLADQESLGFEPISIKDSNLGGIGAGQKALFNLNLSNEGSIFNAAVAGTDKN